MPRKTGKPSLVIPMNRDELDAVHALARARGFKYTNDFVRWLITENAKQKPSMDISFDVDRGGYRERATDAGDDSTQSATFAIAA
jgi:hypothetical protein